MFRYYLTELAGSGTEEAPFRPAVTEHVSGPWAAVDLRADATALAGQMLVRADVTNAEHDAAVADGRVKYLFTRDQVDTRLGTLSPSQVNKLRRWLEANHVSIDHLSATSTLKDVLQAVVRRGTLRQILDTLDLDEDLDARVSDIPAAKRQAIVARLRERDVDMSDVQPNDTVREALRKLYSDLSRSKKLKVREWL